MDFMYVFVSILNLLMEFCRGMNIIGSERNYSHKKVKTVYNNVKWYAGMNKKKYKVLLPDIDNGIEQDEEWLIVDNGDVQKKILFHDYSEIYRIPGLYEDVFHRQLKCRSPWMVCSLLTETLLENGPDPEDLRVLDFGAGNGLAGEEIRKRGANFVVGIDVIEEAREAAQRDRPGCYNDYHVIDMSSIDAALYSELKNYNFNALITVGSLGFGDIPPLAFINSFNLVEDGGWVVFNIKERFLSEDDDTGYSDIMDVLNTEYLDVKKKKKYCHRLSVSGEELYYIAIVGQKKKDVDVESFKNRFRDILLSIDQIKKVG